MFIYDSTFEGFLTAVFEAYRLEDFSGIVAEEDYQKGLFDTVQTVQTDTAKAEKVSAKLRSIHDDIFYTVQQSFLSGEPDKDKIIFAYIQRTVEAGRSLNGNRADPIIGAALECLQRVWREVQRLKGLLRFQELSDGSFYAACEPDHCVLPLLAGHCRARFGGQNWIVHDARRNMALVYQNKDLQLFDAVNIQNVRDKYAAHEQQYQDLWKTFWRNVAIAERKNPRLQKQFMPQRYWKYLIEKN